MQLAMLQPVDCRQLQTYNDGDIMAIAFDVFLNVTT